MNRKREEPEGTKYAVGHFFALNLRNALLRHLVVADQEERKKEHDMRALKGLTKHERRMGAPTGRKVLYAWDRAGIDFRAWYHWKQWGVYFISLPPVLIAEIYRRRWDIERLFDETKTKLG